MAFPCFHNLMAMYYGILIALGLESALYFKRR
jgi:hypothetical protein